jgi:hypothetical protein
LLSMAGYIYSYGLSLAGHSIVTRALRLHPRQDAIQFVTQRLPQKPHM